MKGIVFEGDKVWLRKNEYGEWEIPGGKLDKGEQPTETVVREVKEELGFEVDVERIIAAGVLVIPDSIDEQDGVLVLMYHCKLLAKTGEFEYVGEAGRSEFASFSIDELDGLEMPEVYKEAIRGVGRGK